MAQRAASTESDKSTIGGYNYEFVGGILEEYICSICMMVLRDAHVTDCCGQNFCASCLTCWLAKLEAQQARKFCPQCRKDFQHIVDKKVIRKVNKLKIHCDNHDEGCGWVGELGELKSHLHSDNGCGYVAATCTNEMCGEIMRRKDLQTHLQEKCYYRPYECGYCGYKDIFGTITGKTRRLSHYSVCPEYPLDCPNKCGVIGIRRRAIPDHHNSCPLEPLDCPHAFKGCQKRIIRKDLQIHVQEKCYYRSYECEHCGYRDTYTAITGESELNNFGGHYLECPEYPLVCPNKCDVTDIRRRAMHEHHSSCPLEPLNCPFKDVGCTEKIARKNMEDHIIVNQHKHVLQLFQGFEELRQSFRQMKHDMKREIDILEENIRHNTNTPESTAQSLNRMRSILQVNLNEIGDTLTFRVTNFPQLRTKKKVWHSPTFTIADEVRVSLTVYPSGFGRGQGSHVSVSLILSEVVKKAEEVYLQYAVSITAIGQHRSASQTTLELCSDYDCNAYFPFPSPGEVLQSEELFLKIEEADSLLVKDSTILELKLLEHQHKDPYLAMSTTTVLTLPK